MKMYLMIFFLMTASIVQAEYISWRVFVGSTGAENSFYDSARLFATDTGFATITGATSQGPSVGQASVELGVTPTDTLVTVPNNDQYSFFVALYSIAGGSTPVAYSALRTWDELVLDGSLWNAELPAPLGTTYWNAVPEPTSIGLLAIGMSALLLRRRRRM
jgi:hypothetical protein